MYSSRVSRALALALALAAAAAQCAPGTYVSLAPRGAARRRAPPRAAPP